MSRFPSAFAPAIPEQAVPPMSVVSGTTTLYAHLGDPIDVVESQAGQRDAAAGGGQPGPSAGRPNGTRPCTLLSRRSAWAI